MWHDNSELSILGDESGKCPHYTEFQSYCNFRKEVCSKAKNPSLALKWTKEIAAAKSLDDLITPTSRTANISLIVKNRIWWWRQHWQGATISKYTSERRSVSKSRDFSEGDKLLFDPRKSSTWWILQLKSRIIEVVQCQIGERRHSGLWFTLGACIVVDKWSSIDKVLKGLYVTKLQESFQAQTIMAMYNQDILLGGGKRDNHRLRMCVKLHIEQAQRSDNFRIQSENTERAAVTKGKGQNSFMGHVRKENLAVFYIRVLRETEWQQRKKWGTQEYLASNQPWITSEGGTVKSKHPTLYRREKDRLTWKTRQIQRPTLRLELKSFVYGQDVKDRRVVFDILPCVVITSLETSAFMAIIGCVDLLLVRRNPARSRRNRALKEQLRFW